MGKSNAYRYPGVKNFTKEDRAIFCGRQEDVTTFYTQVMINRTLVLHADSGTGKSSLIQAGFLPLLVDKQNELSQLDSNVAQFLPITIRFDFLKKTVENENKQIVINKEALIEDTVAMIKLEFPQVSTINLPLINDINEDSLWAIGKKMATLKLKPLLIFDQFEELQGYPLETITHFKKELAVLLGTEMPTPVYEAIKQSAAEMSNRDNTDEKEKTEFNNLITFFEKPIDAKVIFVVREDRLGTMSLLSDYFPNILKNDFFLSPLSFQNACIALTEPAMAVGDFDSPQFVFESKEIVNQLVTEIADNQTGLVDPIQIQIVATKIERNCMEKAALSPNADGTPYVVTQEDIPNLGDIINEFYNNCWTNIKTKLALTDAEFETKRNKITSALVINERRDLVNSGWIIDNETREKDQKIVNELLATGLLRVVPYGKVKYYQLCHDRFIKPVSEDQQKYELIKKEIETEKLKKDLESERKAALAKKELYRKIQIMNKVTIAIAVVCIIALYFSVQSTVVANNERKKAEIEKNKAEKEKDKVEIEKNKNLKTLKQLVKTYVHDADIAIAEDEYDSAIAYLNKAKGFLKDNTTDPLYLEIEAKIRKCQEN